MSSTFSPSSLSVKENPRLLFLRIDDSIYIDNYSFTIKCPRLCLNLLFQSRKTKGFCFTEFTTLSMLMIILSQSNVFNFLFLFFQSKKTEGFCFTEFMTLSMLTIILSQSNVLNFVLIFFVIQRKPKASVSQNLRLYLC